MRAAERDLIAMVARLLRALASHENLAIYSRTRPGRALRQDRLSRSAPSARSRSRMLRSQVELTWLLNRVRPRRSQSTGHAGLNALLAGHRAIHSAFRKLPPRKLVDRRGVDRARSQESLEVSAKAALIERERAVVDGEARLSSRFRALRLLLRQLSEPRRLRAMAAVRCCSSTSADTTRRSTERERRHGRSGYREIRPV